MASNPTDKDVPLSDLVFRCDVAYKPIRGITTILPNRLARYHLRLHHDLPPVTGVVIANRRIIPISVSEDQVQSPGRVSHFCGAINVLSN
ncbi:jg18144 [Pararge aegeria aegeria]|uniref:Jg18144 protein n=1 Tax=Pararge aegeria aegeria TaxID=348720 RepID=A0A8S4R8F0_9NEOP|nr:jg18144 [Pararge aegeria aegeria]